MLKLWQRDGISMDLVAVAAHDVLQFGARRARRPDKKRMMKMLLHEYPYLSKREAQALIGDPANERWLKHFRPSDRRINRSRIRVKQFGIAAGSPCGISKVFPHISRRMACYWRKHPDYSEIMRDLETLRPGIRLGASSLALSNSIWQEPHFL